MFTQCSRSLRVIRDRLVLLCGALFPIRLVKCGAQITLVSGPSTLTSYGCRRVYKKPGRGGVFLRKPPVLRNT